MSVSSRRRREPLAYPYLPVADEPVLAVSVDRHDDDVGRFADLPAEPVDPEGGRPAWTSEPMRTPLDTA
jgi:hypothetical protein